MRYYSAVPIERALDSIEALFGRVFVAAESQAYEVFRDINLSFSQARMLFLLGVSEAAIPISDLASRLQLSVAATGRNVDQLVSSGLASREEDLSDRRVKLVSLTESGRKLAWAHHEAKREAVRGLLRTLTTKQCDRIAAALAPLATCQLPSHEKKDPKHVS